MAKDTIQVNQVQKRLLIPLTIILILIVFGFAIAIVKIEQNNHDKAGKKLPKSSCKIFNDALIDQSASLTAIAKIISQNQALRRALREHDRQQLQNLYRDVFLQLKQDYKITHFYFHLPSRINLLRIHQPERHGDFINRFTAVAAEKTQQTSSGIELGPLGTFTLRTVLPILENNILIGYLELGKEIEDILARIHDEEGTEIAVTINKKFLNQKTWEEGMKMLGRHPEWSRYPHAVMTYNSLPSYPEELDSLFVAKEQKNSMSREIQYQNKLWHEFVLPLKDISETEVGHLLIWYDHTSYHAFLNNLIAKVTAGALLFISGLFIYLWINLQKTDKVILNQQVQLIKGKEDLKKAHDEMEKLATTDVLTGLANRRFAMIALERLWKESEQLDSSLACMVIDADHFKQINDNYGHVAGDIVLCELAKHLNYAVRTDDIVCRLGGDEFLIICPNTNRDGLLNIAKQVHKQISGLIIPVTGGSWQGSISVGAAIKTKNMQMAGDLIKSADQGVYLAKNAGKNCVKFV